MNRRGLVFLLLTACGPAIPPGDLPAQPWPVSGDRPLGEAPNVVTAWHGSEAHFRPIGAVGDVDADGYDDLAVGVDAEYHEGTSEEFRIVRGRALPRRALLHDDTEVFAGDAAEYGWGAGDVDADGFADIALERDDEFGPNGPVLALYGGGAVSSWAGQSPLFSLTTKASAGPGRSAGDLDGDGAADLVVATTTRLPDAQGRTEVHIIYGGDALTGDGTVEDWADATLLVGRSRVDTVVLYDLDRDGRADLLVDVEDALHLFYGTPTRKSAEFGLEDADAVVAGESIGIAATIPGSEGLLVDPLVLSAAGHETRRVLAAGPRLTGVVARDALPTLRLATSARAWIGLGVSAVGDLDADGWPDFVNASADTQVRMELTVYYGSPSWLEEPLQPAGSLLVGYREGIDVMPLGDFNGDGCDDLVVTAAAHAWSYELYIVLGAPR